jgi:hypothetical protein
VEVPRDSAPTNQMSLYAQGGHRATSAKMFEVSRPRGMTWAEHSPDARTQTRCASENRQRRRKNVKEVDEVRVMAQDARGQGCP